MKPRHAAALSLVGWYLMTPPPSYHHQPHEPLYDLTAPLKDWVHSGSFDSAKECSQALAEYYADAEKYRTAKPPPLAKNPKGQPVVSCFGKVCANSQEWWSAFRQPRQAFLDSFADGECIASDDPRLKEK
jgi:hypothetical protein